MGKVKKGRRKLHATAKSADKGRQSSTGEAMTVDTSVNTQNSSAKNPFATSDKWDTPSVKREAPSGGGENPFSGIRISKEKLLRRLPDFDTRSTVTSKSLKGLGLKKKEKLKLRHKLWMEKMSAVEAARARETERRRKGKTVVVGDLTDLQETLPTLELLLKKTAKSTEGPTQPRKGKGIEREPKRRKRMLNDIALFKQVLNHPAYKDNPGDTISEHLKNKMQQSDPTNS